MKKDSEMILEKLTVGIPGLKCCKQVITDAFLLIKGCYDNGGKILICGNGGSAADAEHITGELMKGFLLKREIGKSAYDRIKAVFPNEADYLAEKLQGALPAISLVSHSALSTAYINDVASDMVFAQQVYGYGKPGDLLIGLSTSGNSGNVVNAVKVAKAFGLSAIGLTGQTGGAMEAVCDVCIKVPAMETYRVQEYHLPVYHALCAMIEAEYFGTD